METYKAPKSALTQLEEVAAAASRGDDERLVNQFLSGVAFVERQVAPQGVDTAYLRHLGAKGMSRLMEPHETELPTDQEYNDFLASIGGDHGTE